MVFESTPCWVQKKRDLQKTFEVQCGCVCYTNVRTQSFWSARVSHCAIQKRKISKSICLWHNLIKRTPYSHGNLRVSHTQIDGAVSRSPPVFFKKPKTVKKNLLWDEKPSSLCLSFSFLLSYGCPFSLFRARGGEKIAKKNGPSGHFFLQFFPPPGAKKGKRAAIREKERKGKT